ncbi:hypothetical protein N5079_04370 [Planotetraspora sp. A-T 1434]|uniref:hypothetical protein n=1 Tax=Planotetraspora sp. A-T 1434 TaxID=2979219 RepID=UPI0021C20E99|nr:hypothetical protein [Planotetraspora sp. A-T 1434]MCT9929450.1 hypothetical protein [Planotetraspora sp. A-T 1434]
MPITETELRDLLACDSDDGLARGVTVADVNRRVQRIRRRRLASAGAVLAAGLATTGLLVTPHTVTTRAPDDIWSAVMAQPSPTWRPGEYTVTKVLAHAGYREGGVKQRLPFEGGQKAMGLEVGCPAPLYVLVWINGVPAASGPCRGTDASRTGYRLFGEDGEHPRPGTNTVDVLVVAASDLPRSVRTFQRPLNMAEVESVAAGAKPYAVRWNVAVTEMEFGSSDPVESSMLPPTPRSCTKDIVIHKPNGQDVLSSECEGASVGNPFAEESQNPSETLYVPPDGGDPFTE